MSNTDDHHDDAEEMRPYYDFSEAEVGKYYARYQAGTNLARLDEDVAAAFPDSKSVNEALRRYMQIRNLTQQG